MRVFLVVTILISNVTSIAQKILKIGEQNILFIYFSIFGLPLQLLLEIIKFIGMCAKITKIYIIYSFIHINGPKSSTHYKRKQSKCYTSYVNSINYIARQHKYILRLYSYR